MFCAARELSIIVLGLLLTAPVMAEELFSLDWGSDGARVGYYNSTIKDFQDPYPSGPNSFVRTEDGKFLLADTNNDSVLVLGPSGDLLERHGSPDKPDLELVRAVAPGPGGAIFAGLSSGEIVRIKPSGEIEPFYSGQGDGQIGQLHTLAVDAEGNVYAGDYASDRIVVIDSSGERAASLPWELSGFTVAPDGTLYMLRHREDRGYVLTGRTPSGDLVERFSVPARDEAENLPTNDHPGQRKDERPGVWAPELLGIDADGNVYLRHVKPDAMGVLHVRRYAPDGTSFTDLGTHEAIGAEGTFFVTPDGSVLAMQYDAAAAPAGKFVIKKLE